MASVFQQARLGIMSGSAAGSIPAGLSGTFLFDDVIFDDTRLGPALNRFSETKQMTKSGHVFVGSGRLDNLTLIAQATTASVAALYDTDQAGIIPQDKLKGRMTAITSGDTTDLAGVPIYFEKGCYLDLTPTGVATQPRAIIVFQAHAEISEVAKRLHGQKTKLKAGDSI